MASRAEVRSDPTVQLLGKDDRRAPEGVVCGHQSRLGEPDSLRKHLYGVAVSIEPEA